MLAVLDNLVSTVLSSLAEARKCSKFETPNSFYRFPDETLDARLRILLETNLSQNSPDQSQRTQTTK